MGRRKKRGSPFKFWRNQFSKVTHSRKVTITRTVHNYAAHKLPFQDGEVQQTTTGFGQYDSSRCQTSPRTSLLNPSKSKETESWANGERAFIRSYDSQLSPCRRSHDKNAAPYKEIDDNYPSYRASSMSRDSKTVSRDSMLLHSPGKESLGAFSLSNDRQTKKRHGHKSCGFNPMSRDSKRFSPPTGRVSPPSFDRPRHYKSSDKPASRDRLPTTTSRDSKRFSPPTGRVSPPSFDRPRHYKSSDKPASRDRLPFSRESNVSLNLQRTKTSPHSLKRHGYSTENRRGGPRLDQETVPCKRERRDDEFLKRTPESKTKNSLFSSQLPSTSTQQRDCGIKVEGRANARKSLTPQANRDDYCISPKRIKKCLSISPPRESERSYPNAAKSRRERGCKPRGREEDQQSYEPLKYKALEEICKMEIDMAMTEIIRKKPRYIALLNSTEAIRTDLFKLVIESLLLILKAINRPTESYEILRKTSKQLLQVHFPNFINSSDCASNIELLLKIISILKMMLQRLEENIIILLPLSLYALNSERKTRCWQPNDEVSKQLEQLEAFFNTVKKQSNRGPNDCGEDPPDDFRKLTVVPTNEDFRSTTKPFLRANVIKEAYSNVEHYLDVQFRLLREDCFLPLRNNINNMRLISRNVPSEEKGQPEHKISFLFDAVKILNPVCSRHGGVYTIQLDLNRCKLQKIKWERWKRLKFGSLVCLSNDSFENLVFATVENRDLRDLKYGILDLRFKHCNQEVMREFIREGTVFQMLENEAFFEAYSHNLTVLQKMDDDNFPFKEYIVHCNKEIQPPKYLIPTPKATEDHHERALSPLPEFGDDLQSDASSDSSALSSSSSSCDSSPPHVSTKVKIKREESVRHDSNPRSFNPKWANKRQENRSRDSSPASSDSSSSSCDSSPPHVSTKVKIKREESVRHDSNPRGFNPKWANKRQENRSGDSSPASSDSSSSSCDSSPPHVSTKVKIKREESVRHDSNPRGFNPKWANKRQENRSRDSSPHGSNPEVTIKREESVARDSIPQADYSKANYSQREKSKPGVSSQADTEDILLNFSSIVDKDDFKDDVTKVPALQANQWPTKEMLGLDDSQYHAFQLALTKRFALIQGPPGTGKTYVGLKIAQVLIDNIKSLTKGQPSPVLMVSYTNHALDQFLMGINITQGIVRVGGRSKEEKLQKYNLREQKRNLRNTEFENPDIRRERGLLWRQSKDTERENCLQESKQILRESYKGVLSISVLEKFMKREHFNSLKQHQLTHNDATDEKPDGDYNLLRWLQVKRKENERDQNHESSRRFETDDFRRIFDARVFEEEGYEEGEIAPLPKCKVICYPEQAERSADLYSHLKSNREMTRHEENSVRHLFSLRTEERWRLYRLWRNALQLECQQRIYKCQSEGYEVTLQKLDEIGKDEDLNVLQKAKVIGMTTTCAARNHDLLQRIRPKIVIIEEAAEVLEAHILTSILFDCEHVILIGDHQQLRPNCNVHELSKKYNLSISMFERLVTQQMPCERLSVQHRMRP